MRITNELEIKFDNTEIISFLVVLSTQGHVESFKDNKILLTLFTNKKKYAQESFLFVKVLENVGNLVKLNSTIFLQRSSLVPPTKEQMLESNGEYLWRTHV